MNKSIYPWKSTASRYRYLLQNLDRHGTKVQVGPEMTTEVAPFIQAYTDPRERLIDPPGRNLNFAFCVVEALDILMNKNPGLAPKFNRNLANWLDKDGKFPGHYGKRMNSLPGVMHWEGMPAQLKRCYGELLERPTSRRATITIHNPLLENYYSKDVACTMDLQFLIRDEKLHCIAHMRSNDALWGYCYDTWLFQFLQESMASWLNVDLGHYYHIAGSLHYYHQRHKQINRILKKANEPWEQDAALPMEPMNLKDWSDAIVVMWATTQHYINYPEALDTAMTVVWAIPETLKSYQFAILTEIARKHRLREICQEIFQKMPKSDVSQWVKRRCRL